MPVSPARAAAFEILLRVEQKAAYASDLLLAPRWSKLSRPDHALTTEIVMGVLRWQSSLDDAFARWTPKRRKLDPEVRAALRMGVYQITRLDRVPARAAIFESVELVKEAGKRSATGFVNAVLRKVASRSPRPAPPAKSAKGISVQMAHPAWLVERWAKAYGLDAARQICAADQQVPATSVRLQDLATAYELQSEGITLQPGALLASACRVLRGDLTQTLAFREGRAGIQDEASQLVPLLLGEGKRILDCCAAPGGKTIILAARNPQAQITAVELHAHRAKLLEERVTAANVEVVTGDIRTLRPEAAYDRVLVDVPCSGTGTLAHHPEIKWRLAADDLRDLRQKQTGILHAAMNHLAPGGRLLYSSCSLEPEENEAVVEKVLAGNPEFSLLPLEPELARLRATGEIVWSDSASLLRGSYLRTLPGVHPCDGFFAALLERRGSLRTSA
jgi:16S rRNA (cytosine967-C5)-methyltransferase